MDVDIVFSKEEELVYLLRKKKEKTATKVEITNLKKLIRNKKAFFKKAASDEKGEEPKPSSEEITTRKDRKECLEAVVKNYYNLKELKRQQKRDLDKTSRAIMKMRKDYPTIINCIDKGIEEFTKPFIGIKSNDTKRYEELDRKRKRSELNEEGVKELTNVKKRIDRNMEEARKLKVFSDERRIEMAFREDYSQS